MNIRQLWFTDPHKVEIREQQLDSLGAQQILVKNQYSAISAGTELLVYRGQLPENMSLDDSLAAFADEDASYPLQYGYACVGHIEQLGSEVDADLIGTTVFSFQPHASHFVCTLDELVRVPDEVDPKAAVFLANMETAINLVQDGNPRVGERAVVIGQGIVGLLVSKLLAEHPLTGIYALDALESRRNWSKNSGVHSAYSPDSPGEISSLKERLRLNDSQGGADVVFELTGSPEALNLAVELCGFSGRIVVGSWYGTKSAEINLGDRFHRNRIQIVSSQVSTISPELSGRWNKSRRYSVAWNLINKCQPEQLITHCLSLDSASEAYQLLDNSPAETLQVVFDYQK